MATDQFLSVKTVALRLDVKPITVYRLVYAKHLTAVPIGLGKRRPHIRIAESSLRAFMATGTRRAAA
jgi:excisionase family DNA binding protein